MKKCWTTRNFPSSGKVIYPAKNFPLLLLFLLFQFDRFQKMQDLKKLVSCPKTNIPKMECWFFFND